MRILVATDQWYPDLFGGVARVAGETATRLAHAGHEVVVIAPRASDGEATTVREGSLTVARVLRRSHLPSTISDAIATRRWSRRLSDRRFDVLIAHGCNTAHGMLRAGTGLPLVYVFHSDAGQEQAYLAGLLPPGRERLRARALEQPLRRFENIAVREATSIIVLSEFTRTLLGDRAASAAHRATLIPGAVNTSVFRPDDREAARAALNLAPREKVVFTVRRLVPRMGLDNLIDATALLRDNADLRVIIAGTGALEKSLHERASERGLGEQIRFLGRVSEEHLPLWHRAADLFILPTAAYEGFGLVTAEALASGTPVVGTPVGATPELLNPIDPRLLARGTDADALAEAIRTGLELASPALRAKCRTVTVEKHSWDVVMPAWEAVLEEASHAVRNTSNHARGRTIVDLGASGVRWTGAPIVARHIRAHERAGILVYHNPTPETLERHLNVLCRHHQFVSLDGVVDALRTGRWDDIPPKAIAVSLDDGYRTNAALAEIFAAFGIVPTIYLCPELVTSREPFWWTVPNVDAAKLKRISNSRRLAIVAKALAEHPVEGDALTRAQVRELVGAFSFGAHTSTHPILTMCTDDEARREIGLSRSEVEALTGHPCLHFAFPEGSFGEREVELVRRAQYRSARTTIPGWVHPGTDPFRLPILPMPDHATPDRAASQIAIVTFLPQLLSRRSTVPGGPEQTIAPASPAI